MAEDSSALAHHFHTRQNPRFFGGLEDSALQGRRSSCVEEAWIAQAVAEAQRVRQHVFQYGGLGPVELGASINWRKDPYSGSSANLESNALHNTAPDGDLRTIWELNRCHQWVTLGLAYRYTGDDAYVEEIIAQFRSWSLANPPGHGVNWASAMESSIRIINWLWAFYLCRDSPRMTDQVIAELIRGVKAHGDHILNNLERSAVSNNHYLTNGVGLLHLGILFPELKDGQRWLRAGRRIVFQETLNQVTEDGVDFEGSTAYHGFVLDMLIPTIALCLHNDVAVPDDVLHRLEQMVAFTVAYTRPDGSIPQMGDSDEGRLVPLSSLPRNVHGHLLTLGTILFQREDFKKASCGWCPEACWLFGEAGLKRYQEVQASPTGSAASQGFPRAGVFCLRHQDLHMVIDCAEVGLRGRGGHGHNDCLSFELFAYGETFITDSGTYRYSAPEAERNLFRSTAAHNTALVDGQEMARMVPGDPWRIHDDARPTVHLWHTSETVDMFDGSHDGYCRLPNPIRHRRRVMFDKVNRLWVLEDRFLGSGPHLFEVLFHFAPMSVGLADGDGLVVAAQSARGANLSIIPLDPAGVMVDLRQGWVSQRYGTREEAPVACYSLRGVAPMSLGFCLYPSPPGEAPDVVRLRHLALTLAAEWRTRSPGN